MEESYCHGTASRRLRDLLHGERTTLLQRWQDGLPHAIRSGASGRALVVRGGEILELLERTLEQSAAGRPLRHILDDEWSAPELARPPAALGAHETIEAYGLLRERLQEQVATAPELPTARGYLMMNRALDRLVARTAEAVHAREERLAGATRELRELIGIITSNAWLLAGAGARPASPRDARRYADRILAAGKEAGRLLGDLDDLPSRARVLRPRRG